MRTIVDAKYTTTNNDYYCHGNAVNYSSDDNTMYEDKKVDENGRDSKSINPSCFVDGGNDDSKTHNSATIIVGKQN